MDPDQICQDIERLHRSLTKIEYSTAHLSVVNAAIKARSAVDELLEVIGLKGFIIEEDEE